MRKNQLCVLKIFICIRRKYSKKFKCMLYCKKNSIATESNKFCMRIHCT